jgi:hypothetical protein
MSDPLCHAEDVMKLRSRFLRSDRVVEEVARFGGARMLRLSSGRVVVRGGTVQDRREAREWASLFCHEAVFDVVEPGVSA